ncbi:hypothetical protein U3516DRAFT_576938, partial [Neocallimastix sp. 'constans']
MIPDVKDNNIVIPLHEIIEKSLTKYIINPFFPWVLLLLLLNGKNYKRKANYILVFHWLFRATGDTLNTMVFSDKTVGENEKYYWPYNKKNQFRCICIAYVFWTIGEILGDWYPLLRVKAVSENNRSMKFVYITCMLYNCTKIFGVVLRFIRVPEVYKKNLSEKEGSYYPNRDILQYKLILWTVILVIQILCFIYDTAIIMALKKCLFDKLKEYNTNSFIDVFKVLTSRSDYNLSFIDLIKTMSEFRIILSMISSFFFIPFIILFIIIINKEYLNVINFDSYKASNSNFEEITYSFNNLRDVVLGIDYTFMYIDQFLLRYLASKKERSYTTNGTSDTYGINDIHSGSSNPINNNNIIFGIHTHTIKETNSYEEEISRSSLLRPISSSVYLSSLASINQN